MNRQVPLRFVQVLIRPNWYSMCSGIVKWNSCISHLFVLRCGVRQGGVLSLVLFAVYVNDIINKLELSKLGCCIGNLNICCLFYADDIILLSRSVSKLQHQLNMCNAELEYLDLKCNIST